MKTFLQTYPAKITQNVFGALASPCQLKPQGEIPSFLMNFCVSIPIVILFFNATTKTSRKNTVLCVLFIDTTLKTYLYNKNEERYHFYANTNCKVSFDSQLNYVLHRDKASEHNNHDIRRKLCKLKHYLHLVII